MGNLSKMPLTYIVITLTKNVMENSLNSRLYSCEDMKENINGLIIAPPSVTPGPDNKNCPEIRPGQLMELSLVQWEK